MELLRWDDVKIGDRVDMSPQGFLRVISRDYDSWCGLYFLGLVHPRIRKIWRIAYTSSHKVNVIQASCNVRRERKEGIAIEKEVQFWMNYALSIRDLLDSQNKALYEAAHLRDLLLHEGWYK